VGYETVLARVENITIARPQDALEAAAAVARRTGYTPVILGNPLEGGTRSGTLLRHLRFPHKV
jgi:glycerate 2-kinase